MLTKNADWDPNMPRYFFNVHDGREVADADGTELPDLRSARLQAVGYAGEMMRDHPERFWDGEEWVMVVTDARGDDLFALTFCASIAPSLAAATSA